MHIIYLFEDDLVKVGKIKMSNSCNATTNRKLLNKQSKNLSMYGYESQDIPPVDKFSTEIVTTKSISTQTGGIGLIERNERQILRPRTAKINR